VAYSDWWVEKGWVIGGGVVECESEGWWPSEGLPRIAERMVYSRLAASEPNGKDGTSKAVSNRGSVEVKVSMAAHEQVRRGMTRH
jgi:hypothetical protein